MSSLLVFLLHFPSHPAATSLPSVPLLAPHKSFIRGEILPVFVELQHALFASGRISKSLIFAHILLKVFSSIVGLGLFRLDFFEGIAVDSKEAALAVLIALEAASGEVIPDVEAKSELVDILLAHVLLVEQQFLTVVVVPRTLIWVRKHVVGLVYLHEAFLCTLFGVFVRVILERHLTIVLDRERSTVLISAAVALQSTSSTS